MEAIQAAATTGWDWAGGGAGTKRAPPVRGKRDAVHRPGNKAELRRALIDQKRAERSSKAGHFEASVLCEALVRAAAGEPPGGWRSAPLGGPGLRLALRLGAALGLACTEQGSGERRVVVYVRREGEGGGEDELDGPSESAVAEARALAAAFDATASGAGVAGVVSQQRAVARKVRDKRAKEAAGQPLTRKLRQVYPDRAGSSSSSSEGEGKERGGGEAPHPGHVVVLRTPMVFVKARGTTGGLAGEGDSACAEAEGGVGGGGRAASGAAVAVASEEEGEEEGEHTHLPPGEAELDSGGEKEEEEGSSGSHTGSEEDGRDGGRGERSLGARAGLGSSGWGVPDVSSLSLGDGAAPPLTSPTVVRAEWEGYTRGVGSALLARMGYAGGELGRRARAHASASHSHPPSDSGAPARAAAREADGGGADPQRPLQAAPGVLPEPIGERVEVRKALDRRGVGM